jgi:hypothetical protein
VTIEGASLATLTNWQSPSHAAYAICASMYVCVCARMCVYVCVCMCARICVPCCPTDSAVVCMALEEALLEQA